MAFSFSNFRECLESLQEDKVFVNFNPWQLRFSEMCVIGQLNYNPAARKNNFVYTNEMKFLIMRTIKYNLLVGNKFCFYKCKYVRIYFEFNINVYICI